MQNFGNNVTIEVKGNEVTLKFDISKRLGPSSSGKTTIVASTNGNLAIPGHEDVKIGLNVFTKK